MLGKIATAGHNGRFRTPRHIIRLMVEIVEPKKPTDVVCGPACGTCGFLVALSNWLTLWVEKLVVEQHLPISPSFPHMA